MKRAPPGAGCSPETKGGLGRASIRAPPASRRGRSSCWRVRGWGTPLSAAPTTRIRTRTSLAPAGSGRGRFPPEARSSRTTTSGGRWSSTRSICCRAGAMTAEWSCPSRPTTPTGRSRAGRRSQTASTASASTRRRAAATCARPSRAGRTRASSPSSPGATRPTATTGICPSSRWTAGTSCAFRARRATAWRSCRCPSRTSPSPSRRGRRRRGRRCAWPAGSSSPATSPSSTARARRGRCRLKSRLSAAPCRPSFTSAASSR